MCQALGRALRRHCDFSKDTFNFLDEMKEGDDLEQSNFSYKFNEQLKVTSTGEKIRERMAGEHSDDADIEERDENIDDVDIQLETKELRHIEKLRRDEILK
jgi:hypothetical protein